MMRLLTIAAFLVMTLASALVKEHLATFQQWPLVSALANQARLERTLEDLDSGR